MNIENKELIEKTTSVLDKIMNFFKKVVNKQTITDKGALHHTGDLAEGTDVFQDEDMTSPAVADTYTTANGSQLAVKGGQVQKVTPPDPDEDLAEPYDDDDTSVSGKFKSAKKQLDVQNRLQEIKAKLHAQNILLTEAKAALEAANTRLNKTREDIKNEIHSDFTPPTGGTKRSDKAKTEPLPFFAPQTILAQNAVRKAVSK